MASKSSQVQALMATTRATTVAPPLAQGYAPMFAQYNRWSTIYGTSLPRTFDTFRSGDFSPFEPILPNPIDIPEPSGRPRPRRWQFPVGWNLPVGQPGTEGIKLANFQVLRDLAEVGSIPRRAIEICKLDITNQHWSIVATPMAEKAMQGRPELRSGWEERRAELTAFFDDPDPHNYYGWTEWINALLEDLIVLDAVAIHIQPPRGGKKAGPLGSNIGALELIDGTSIRPLLDTWGAKPSPPQPAYQQLIWGVPRVDLMDVINLGPDATIEDLKELDPLIMELMSTVDEWSADQMVYLRANPRTWTPYGFGPLEQCLLPVSIMMARQTWQWEFYRAGSLPSVFLDPGEMVVTAEEARELQEAINMTGGDLASRHQVLVLPPGAKVTPQKATDLADTFDELMIAEVAMSFGLSITDFGMTPKVAALNSPEAARSGAASSADKTVRRSTLPRVRLIERFLTKLIQTQFGCDDMMMSAGIKEQGENESDLDARWIGRVKASVVSIDEGRMALDLDPYGEPWSSVPLAFFSTGVSPLPTSVQSATLAVEQMQNPPAPAPAPAPDALPPVDSASPATAAHAGARAAEAAKSLVRGIHNAHPHAVRRDLALTPLHTHVADQLGRLVNQVRHHKLQTTEFEPAAIALLTRAIVGAAHLGAKHAAMDHNVNIDKQTEEVALQRAARQRPYLLGFAMAALSGSLSAVMTQVRAHLYGDALTGAYEQGYGNTALAAWGTPDPATAGLSTGNGVAGSGSEAVMTWHAENDDSTCDLCAARDGERYTAQTLPGWPGDGSFGGPICMGGPNCRCTITYSDGNASEIGRNTLRPASLAGDLSAELGPAGHRRRWSAQRETFRAALPDVVRPGELYSARARAAMRDQIRQQIAAERGIHPADVPARSVADRVPPTYKSASLQQVVTQQLEKRYPDDALTWVADMRWRTDSVALKDISVTGPAGKRDARTIRRMAKKMRKGKAIKPVVLVDPGDGGLLQVADGHHRVTAALHAKRRVVPAYVGRPKATDNTWRHAVMQMQMLRLEKQLHSTWIDTIAPSPVLNGVPVDRGPSGTGPLSAPEMPGGGLVLAEGSDSAWRNPSMVGKIQVEDPSDDPVRHEFGNATQLHMTKGETAAGIAVRARDSGRVLLLQRSLSDPDDANAGHWEWPGGCLEPDEEPLDAAVREWQEEMGIVLPPGEVVDQWLSPTGVYRGYLYEVPAEADVALNLDPDRRAVINPDDPDQDYMETAAWFDPAELAANPAVRTEVRSQTPWSLFG